VLLRSGYERRSETLPAEPLGDMEADARSGTDNHQGLGHRETYLRFDGRAHRTYVM
jgi:hypothetical protein